MKKSIIFILALSIWSITLIAQTDKFKSDAYFTTANKYFDKEDYKTTILYCDSAIATNSENLEAYAFRGVSKFELKQYEDAIKDFDLTLILNDGYSEIYYYRGLAKFELGAKKQACEDWFEAYSLGYKEVIKMIENNCELEKDKKKKTKQPTTKEKAKKTKKK